MHVRTNTYESRTHIRTHLVLLGALLLHGLDGALIQRPAEREERHENGPRNAPRVDPIENKGS